MDKYAKYIFIYNNYIIKLKHYYIVNILHIILIYDYCHRLNVFVPLPPSPPTSVHMLKPNPSMMVFGTGAFGR